jgi:hypothetical protein
MMAVPTEQPRQATARDLFYFTHRQHWVTWPFLPVLRRHADGSLDFGSLYDAMHHTGRTGFSNTVFLCDIFRMPATEAELLALPKEIFDTTDEMAAAGWRVD